MRWVISIKIDEIRKYFLNHSQYFLDKNNVNIEDIKSQNKYYFKGKCGHEFLSLPCSVFVDGDIHCPVCSGRQVQIGVNDL